MTAARLTTCAIMLGVTAYLTALIPLALDKARADSGWHNTLTEMERTE